MEKTKAKKEVKMLKKNKLNLMLVLIFSVLFFSGLLFADPEVPPGISQQEELPGQAWHKGWQRGKHKGWDKEDFLKLKEEDPQKFNQLFEERREALKERLTYLKEHDPQRYHQLMQKIRERRLAQLRRLKQEDPEKFKQIVQARKKRAEQYLKRLKKEDPEKYKQMMQQRQEFQELRRLKREDPEKFKESLNKHPRWRRRFENSPDSQQGYWDMREDNPDKTPRDAGRSR